MRCTLFLLTLITLCFILTCDSPYNPFEETDNAKGFLEISSASGTTTDTAFIDSTGHSIDIRASLFLLKFIESITATVNYDDGKSDTIFDSLFRKGETADNLTGSTSIVFLRGGRVVVRLTARTTDGLSSTDSAVLLLHRSPVKLSALTIDSVDITPSFYDTTFEYAATVPNAMMYLTLRPETDNPYSSITINDKAFDPGKDHVQWPLMTGENTFTIKSITDDGSIVVTYTLTVYRDKSEKADASLSDIHLSKGTLTPAFKPDSLRYRVMLPFADSMVAITPYAADTAATILIDGKPAPHEVTLPVGNDSVVISVIAVDSITNRTYAIIFDRAQHNSALLMKLIPSAGSLFPLFNPAIHQYSIIVADTVSAISFTTEPLDENATVKINDASPDSLFGLLPNASTPFNFVVTADDGTTKLTYIVTVTRAGSDFARLVELAPSIGTLVPAFYFDTADYELRVPSDSTSIRVKPIAAHSLSTITANGTLIPSGAWSQDITCSPGKNPPFTITIKSAAGTDEKTYQVTVNRAFTLTIRSSGNGATTPDGTIDAFTGTPQPISAVPAAGFRFDRWSLVSGSATVAAPGSHQTSVGVESATVIKADFIPARYSLTVIDTGEGAASGSDSVAHGVANTIIAKPDTGHVFFKWQVTEGCATIADSVAAATTVKLESGDATVRAVFTRNIYQLTLTTNGHGTAIGNSTVAHGISSPIIARPDTGYHFTGWQVTGGSAVIGDSTSDSTTATLENGNATISALFAINRYLLTLQTIGSGEAKGPDNDSVNHGEAIPISAAPGSGYFFFNWRVVAGKAQIANSDSPATTVTLKNGDATIEAVFSMKTYWLIAATDDKGTVTGTGSVAQGIPAAITANADPGYHFKGWWVTTGSATIADPAADSTAVTLETGNATVKASFAVNRYYLSMSKIGDGAVTSSDSVNHGVETEINATALSGNHFVAWRIKSGNASIADSTKANTTVMLKNGNAKVEGVFSINRYQLSLSSNGNGIVRPPEKTVTHGEADSISATPNTGYHFIAWRTKSGSASINDSTKAATTVSLKNGNAEIEAVFAINRYILTLGGIGNGDVRPASDTVNHGEADSIIATPDIGYHFVKWSVASGSASIADSTKAATTITLLNGSATALATFAINRYKLTMAKIGSGEIDISPVVDSVTYGQEITVTATATGTGCQPFKVWRRSNTNVTITDSNAAGTTLLLSGNVTVTAVFITTFDTMYVDSAATGSNTGASWKQAFNDLQTALLSAEAGTNIFMAKGSYYPSTTDRTVSFVLKNGVRIYGGYPTGGGARNVDASVTILSGEIQKDGTKDNNSRTIVKVSNVDSSCKLDGVTIHDGYGDGEPGGGMDVVEAGVVIENCTFTQDSSTDSGGAMYISGGAPVIRGCEFIKNSSPRGGAIFSNGNITVTSTVFLENLCKGLVIFSTGGAVSSSGNALFNNCQFSKNTCYGREGGGGALFLTGNTQLYRCSFINNSVVNISSSYFFGGAVYCLENSSIFINCIFSKNICSYTGSGSSSPVGGGIMINSGSSQLINCNITENSTNPSNGIGGGLAFNNSKANNNLVINNCIIWGNSAAPQFANFFYGNSAPGSIIKNSIIQGGFTSDNITIDSLFTDDPLLGTLDSTSGPIPFIPIPSNSPARDKGTTAVPSGIDISTDGRGYPRSDGKPDIGAYEVQ